MYRLTQWLLDYVLPVVLFTGAQWKGWVWLQYAVLAQVAFTIGAVIITRQAKDT